MSRPIDELRVLVADDHALYRRGLVMQLDDADDLEVIAEAASGEEAVETASQLAPDVVLMDVRMPGMGGIAATRRLSELIPTTRILMLSVSDEDEDLFEAVRAGAAGYLLKETSIVEIADAARKVAQGHSFVSPTLARRLLQEFAAMAGLSRVPGEVASSNPLLTEREVEVLRALSDGADNVRLADVTGLTEHAARNHVRNILEKLQLHTRAEAVLYAVRTRLVDP